MNNNNYNDEFNSFTGNDNTENNSYSNSSYNNNGYSNEQANNFSNPYTNANADNSQQTGYNSGSEYCYVYKNNTPMPENSQTAPVNNQSFAHAQKKTKKKSTGKSFAKIIAAALCFGIVAGSVMVGVNYAGNKLLDTSSATTGNSSSSSVKSTTGVKNTAGGTVNTTYDVSSVVENVMPAMVSINIKVTTSIETPYNQFFDFGYGGDTYEYETEGSGSGIIISENSSELLIVTNNHVVEDATEINVSFIDGKSCSATTKGTDPDYDLAVISVKLSDIPTETKDAIAIATLGDSNSLQLGQPAIAIGNALGYGQSVTVGYISALEREVQMTDNTMTLIQTDAAINPGNSGGALIDMNGNVIGINSAKYSDTDVEGMGYAIPISDASPIIDGLINQTTLSESETAYLGITGTDVTEAYAQFGLPTGVYVSKVNSDSPAAKADIQAGDIIVKFDGNDVSTMEGLQSKIKSHKVGDVVDVVLQRQQPSGDYEEVTVSVTLGSKADAPETESSQSAQTE